MLRSVLQLASRAGAAAGGGSVRRPCGSPACINTRGLSRRGRRWLHRREGGAAGAQQQHDLRWAGAVSKLVDLAGEHRERLQHDHALPVDPWEEGARAVQLGEAIELLQELAQREVPGKLHEQHVLSDISWALASLGAHDRMLLQWLQSQALASAESMQGRALARIAWAMGHLNAEDSEQLLHALGQRAAALLHSGQSELKPTDVSQLAWACAVHNVASAALESVVLATGAGAWSSRDPDGRERDFGDNRVLDDLRRLHPFLLDLQLQGHPVVDRNGALIDLCETARSAFVQSAIMFADQQPSSFQRGVTDALSRNEWLKRAVGRELGFPPYLADDSVQAEVVLLDPIPLLRDPNESLVTGKDDAEDGEDEAQIVPDVPWPAAGYVVDLYMPAYRLVVEADGPSHWCRGTDDRTNRALGRTALKHRLLREAGYLLVSVPTYWSTNRQTEDDDHGFESWMNSHSANQTPIVATAWTGDADAWKRDDLAGTGSRNWPQQPSEHLGGRLLELILEAAEETHGMGERRWDAAKDARETEFLTGKTSKLDRNRHAEMTPKPITAAQRRRQQQRSSSLKSGNGAIFLSRRKQSATTPKPSANTDTRRANHSADRSKKSGGQQEDSGRKHRTTTQKIKQKKKRHEADLDRAAAVRKLKERQRLAGKRRGGFSTGGQSHEKTDWQRSEPAGNRLGDQSARPRVDSSTDRAVDAAKLPLNPHDVLGLTRGATRREIKRAFRALSLRYHPDRNDKPGAAARFAELGAAAEQLLKPKQPLRGDAGARRRRQQ